MKKRLLILCSLVFCFLLVMTGCGPTEVNYFTPTTLSIFDYYSQNMLGSPTFVSLCANSAPEMGASDKTKVSLIMGAYAAALEDENEVMASIECFNGVGVDESSGSRVGYYECRGTRYKVYINEGLYVVEYTLGAEKVSKAFAITKNDNVYNVIKRKENGESITTIYSALVQYDAATSNMMMEITCSNEHVASLKLKKEMIVLKNGEIVSRDVITLGNTNNKAIYTVEYIRTVFNASIKIAKSSADAGRINKDTFDPETFASALSTDMTGYKFVADLAENNFSATAFGEASAWVV